MGRTHGLDFLCEWSWDSANGDVHDYDDLLHDEQYESYILSLIYRLISGEGNEFNWHGKTMRMYFVEHYEWEFGTTVPTN